MTAERRKRNRMGVIKAGDETECYIEKEIAEEIAKYFEGLFTIDHPRDCEDILEGILRTIIEATNRNLTKMVEKQEIKKAHFSKQSFEAPVPDGIPLLFVQKYWYIVGSDM